MTLTTRTRLALWFAAALGAILAAFSVAAYLILERTLYGATDARLRARVEEIEHGFDADGQGKLYFVGRVPVEDSGSPLTEVIRVADGAVVWKSDDLHDDRLGRT